MTGPGRPKQLAKMNHDRRLSKERSELEAAGYAVTDSDGVWHVQMNSELLVELDFPELYPLRPPAVKFLAPIPVHAHVDIDSGLVDEHFTYSEEEFLQKADKGSEDGHINVNVKTLTGKEVEIGNICAGANVAQLMVRIKEAEGIPCGQQRMIFGGRQTQHTGRAIAGDRTKSGRLGYR